VKEGYLLVIVDWLDITSHDGAWLDIEEAKKYVPSRMRTVGFLLKEEPDYIVVVSTVSDDLDTVGSANAIPRGCLISISPLQQTGECLDKKI